MPIASPAQRRLVWLLLAGQVAVLVGLLLYPVNSIMVRVPLLALLPTIWLTLVGLATPLRWLRNGVLALPVLAFCALTFPGRVIDRDDLRLRIVAALRSYEGATYVWGGENGLGIDCSGLVRRARIDAEWSSAWARADAGAARRALSLWWNDQSANAMGDNEGATTVALGAVPRLADCPPERCPAGDFAVLGGVHVLASLGGGTWIEADPGVGKVIVLRPGAVNAWLNQPAKLTRWTALAQP
jgi:hypothetical protein